MSVRDNHSSCNYPILTAVDRYCVWERNFLRPYLIMHKTKLFKEYILVVLTVSKSDFTYNIDVIFLPSVWIAIPMLCSNVYVVLVSHFPSKVYFTYGYMCIVSASVFITGYDGLIFLCTWLTTADWSSRNCYWCIFPTWHCMLPYGKIGTQGIFVRRNGTDFAQT